MSGWQLWIEEERLLCFFFLSSRTGVVQPFTREDAPPLQLYSRVLSYSSSIYFYFCFLIRWLSNYGPKNFHKNEKKN